MQCKNYDMKTGQCRRKRDGKKKWNQDQHCKIQLKLRQ